jgi:hypothetical protein
MAPDLVGALGWANGNQRGISGFTDIHAFNGIFASNRTIIWVL